jgi:hypothetical protein
LVDDFLPTTFFAAATSGSMAGDLAAGRQVGEFDRILAMGHHRAWT